MKLGLLTPVLAALLCAALCPARSQISSPLETAADSLRKLVASGVVPSVAFSVSSRARPIYEDAFGYADIERQIKATPNTAYPVASVAKSYTAIGALRAFDRGVLDLDRPVNGYLGADSVLVPTGEPRRLTARTLLHMTAGIPHVVRFYWPDEPSDRSWDTRLGHFAAFPPGTQFHYSNQSLGIVGEALAHISGKSFPRYMAEEVFRPLGLENTAVRLNELHGRGVANAYRDKPTRLSGFTRLDPEPGAGMYTSVHDLTTFARKVILNPDSRFLSPRARRELTDFSQYPFYSAGWWKDPFRPDGLTLVADGAALGHAASMLVLPGEGLAVAVVVNGPVPDGYTLQLCDLLLRAAGYREAPAVNHDIPAAFIDRPVAKDSSWAGSWRGFVRTRTSSVPIRLVFDTTGMSAALGIDSMHHANATVSNGILESGISGELPRENVGGLAHALGIRLVHDGDSLTGYVNATVKLSDRPFLMVPFYVSLKRAQ